MCDVNRRDALARFTVGHDLKHRIAGISKVSGLVNCKIIQIDLLFPTINKKALHPCGSLLYPTTWHTSQQFDFLPTEYFQ